MSASCPDPRHCVTCADDGIPMLVVGAPDPTSLALCAGDDGGEPVEVDVTLVEPVAAGDTVLVHAGVALARVATPDPVKSTTPENGLQ
jgi:hydrogenase maturation factor